MANEHKYSEQEVLNAVYDDTNGALKTNTTVSADIEIGQVELKDSDSIAQANIKAANTARTMATVVLATQNIDAAGNVIGIDAANTARTTGTKVLPTQPVDAAGAVLSTSALATSSKQDILDTSVNTLLKPANTLAGVTTVTTVSTLTGGGVADNGADSGNPVKTGAKYNATAPTYVDGDRADNQADVNGNLQVNNRTLISGEDQTNDVMKTEQQFTYSYISTATTTAVKAAAGFLHTITVQGGTAGTIIIYDNTAGSGTIVASFDSTNALATYTLDIKMATGITVVTGAATKLTVSFR